MTDPISDFLICIKNGYRAGKSSVVVPYSKMREGIAGILEGRKYIEGFEKKGRKVRKYMEVKLCYDGKRPALEGVRRVSKPSRRLYVSKDKIKPVRQGFGLSIISTSRGLMTGEEARKSGLGGEIIAEVW